MRGDGTHYPLFASSKTLPHPFPNVKHYSLSQRFDDDQSSIVVSRSAINVMTRVSDNPTAAPPDKAGVLESKNLSKTSNLIWIGAGRGGDTGVKRKIIPTQNKSNESIDSI